MKVRSHSTCLAMLFVAMTAASAFGQVLIDNSANESVSIWLQDSSKKWLKPVRIASGASSIKIEAKGRNYLVIRDQAKKEYPIGWLNFDRIQGEKLVVVANTETRVTTTTRTRQVPEQRTVDVQVVKEVEETRVKEVNGKDVAYKVKVPVTETQQKIVTVMVDMTEEVTGKAQVRVLNLAVLRDGVPKQLDAIFDGKTFVAAPPTAPEPKAGPAAPAAPAPSVALDPAPSVAAAPAAPAAPATPDEYAPAPAPRASFKINSTERTRAPTPPKLEYPKPNSKLELVNSLGMKLKRIPAGVFLMGSAEDSQRLKESGVSVEFDNNDDERPQHKVNISEPYYIGVHEVTLGQFLHYYAADPQNHQTEGERDGYGGLGGSFIEGTRYAPQFSPWATGWNTPVTDYMDHPVVNVSWNDAMSFCRWLTTKDRQAGLIRDDQVYCLPTEAQWECACRGGTGKATLFSFGNDPLELTRYANVGDTTAKRYFESINAPWENYHSRQDGFVVTAPTASLEPNAFGLFDMHGNVQEWCLDTYHPETYAENIKAGQPVSDPLLEMQSVYFVIRGGGWNDNAWSRCADRRWLEPWIRYDSLGFRVALVNTNSPESKSRQVYQRLAAHWSNGYSAMLKLPDSDELKPVLIYLHFLARCSRREEANLKDELADIYKALQLTPGSVNNVGWMLVTLFEYGKLTDPEILKISFEPMERSIAKQTGAEKGAHLDTLAHLKFLNGDTKEAIRLEKQAIELVDGQAKQEFEAYLQKLQSK